VLIAADPNVLSVPQAAERLASRRTSLTSWPGVGSYRVPFASAVAGE